MKANQSGRASEQNVAAALRHAGVLFDAQVLLGRTIYDTELRVDFIARNLSAFPKGLVIESKWQDRDGTVDEKFPYLVENIRHCYPLPAVVVLHGGGCRPGARQWLRTRVDGQRLVAVFNLEELTSWALRAKKQSGAMLFTGIVR